MPPSNANLKQSVYSDRPRAFLIALFAGWKLLLFCLVLLAPGPGYDTSTTLLPSLDRLDESLLTTRLQQHVATRLVRWDAIYFTQVAKRGYLYEQEWAFGWSHTQLLGLASRLLFGTDAVEAQQIALTGILLAHLFHLASTLLLYELTRLVFEGGTSKGPKTGGHDGRLGPRIALLSSMLHVLNPAGVFLSAPYAEPLFSALNFTGFYFYTKAAKAQSLDNQGWGLACQLIAGILFGIATTVRGNGLFSGVIFAFDAATALWDLITSASRVQSLSALKNGFTAGAAGVVMAAIAALPQVLAYREYCIHPSPTNRRSWCQAVPPSIYTWVQKEYWGVGFLQYWTISNIPLFLLAAPMIIIMGLALAWVWTLSGVQSESAKTTRKEESNKRQDHPGDPSLRLLKISLPQVLLLVLALTTYHVQVITRLSSGYPVWYWWLAQSLIRDTQQTSSSWKAWVARTAVGYMVVYSLTQGALYATFLPPA